MTAKPVRRIGVFGGTFDPPHIGHLVAARNAQHALGLDVVLFVVAGEPWQKVGSRVITPAADRVAMASAAAALLPGAEVCTLEVERGGPSYTVETLEALGRVHPGAELVLLVGRDAALGMPTWERFEDVCRLATVAMIDRPLADGAPAEDPPWVVHRVPIPRLDIASTELRRRVAAGEPLDFLVPPEVVSIIADRSLYRGRPL